MFDKFYNVLLKPHMSEKSMAAADSNGQIVFYVTPNSSKKDIKHAVQNLFDVKVKSVNTLKVNGKLKSFKQKPGQRKSYKKAIVALEDGYDINFLDNEK